MMRKLLRWLLRLLYGFRAYNEGVLNTAGPVLLLPNHVSWWDWVLIGVCVDEDWRFVTSGSAAEVSWIHKRIMVNRRTFPVDMHSPYAVKHMAEYLKKGGRLVLFPEGRLSMTGSLMKLFEGTGFLLEKTQPKVIVAYLRGAHRLPFSRNEDRKQWFPRVSAHFHQLDTLAFVKGPGKGLSRAQVTDRLRDAMVWQQFRTEMEFGPASLPAAIDEQARFQPSKVVLQDASLKELSFRQLDIGAHILATRWKELQDVRRVGVLLPNVLALPVVLLSLWRSGRIPALLNYSTGVATMISCARLSGLKQIITSRAFLERAKLNAAPLQQAGLELIFLEDVRAKTTTSERVLALIGNLLGMRGKYALPDPQETAAILFTSGSEGEPKGVELTHTNVLANTRQMRSVIDVNESDRFFNAMPVFHSFGLTVGLFLPLTRGVFTLLYPSPLHYRIIPAAFYNLNCTVLFGTNTFLAGYVRKAHPYDFRSLRYVFAAAEKLQETTVLAWMQKFGIRILEGYGATECGPCLTANVPMHPRAGSVGKFLPDIQYRLEPVEGVTAETGHAGRLFVRGPNIMRGYLNPEANARFKALEGWYDTGDIVRVDGEEFAYIMGRLKRFAKVSGEMVSLTAVEEALHFPEFGNRFGVAILARQDDSKGEKLVAVTNEPKLTLSQVRETVRARGFGNLALPRELKLVHDIPRLGTGKINYRELERLV